MGLVGDRLGLRNRHGPGGDLQGTAQPQCDRDDDGRVPGHRLKAPAGAVRARVVIQPKDGEAWAIAYTSIFIRAEGDRTPAYKFMTWSSGRVEAQTASYRRVFDEELKKAGFHHR